MLSHNQAWDSSALDRLLLPLPQISLGGWGGGFPLGGKSVRSNIRIKSASKWKIIILLLSCLLPTPFHFFCQLQTGHCPPASTIRRRKTFSPRITWVLHLSRPAKDWSCCLLVHLLDENSRSCCFTCWSLSYPKDRVPPQLSIPTPRKVILYVGPTTFL